MADVNNSPVKRKTLDSEMIFEIGECTVSPPNSPRNGTLELVPKVVKKGEFPESTLYPELSQTSVETNISIIEKLSELQEENMKLKRQLEEVTSKVCKCNLNVSTGSDESDVTNPDSHITVKFMDQSIADEYRHKFLKFLKSFMELTCTENKLNINIRRKGTDEIDLMSPSKKRKRKKSKSKSKDLFVVDTTPSVAKNDSTLKYTSKYLVTCENDITEKDSNQKCSPAPATVCFNCDQNHSLRDCPQPKNFVKINAARNKLKLQHAKTRYHTDDEQKYAHLKPGVVSSELKKALGICSNELPPYIYRMRYSGYPPGWMEDARITHSNISLYDMDGKELSVKNSRACIDPGKVVEYPGFNMPLDKGVKDDYKYYSCPPYSEKYSKNSMLEFIKQKVLKEHDNLETCDMDLDQSSDEVAPPGCEPKPVVRDRERLSPSLIALERKKMELLAELGENNTNSSAADEKVDITETVSVGEEDNRSNKLDDTFDLDSSAYIIIDESQPDGLSQNDEPNDKEKDQDVVEIVEDDDEVGTPKTDLLKKSTFGTPIVKGASPYSRLPDPANFSKDISPVINFENLPNATGKYEQMSCILQKIRRTLKNSGDKL
ncbi:hypothetical protein Trydic_g18152 [Trypoxylus dichotomus]